MASAVYPVHRSAGMASARINADGTILVESGTDDAGLARLRRFGAMVYEAMMALPANLSTKPKHFDAELRRSPGDPAPGSRSGRDDNARRAPITLRIS